MGQTTTSQHRLLFLTLSLTYIATGILSALPGASLLQLASNTHVSLAVIGSIFTLSACGFMFGALSAGALMGRMKPQYILAAGLLFLAVGSLGLPLSSSFPLLLVAQLIKGSGFGLIDISLNSIATWSFQGHLGESLNMIHSMYGLGALLGPLVLAGALQFFQSLPLAYLVGALVATVPLFLILGQPVPAQPAELQHDHSSATQRRTAARRVLLHGLLWLMILQISLYAGAEVGFANWIVTVVSKSAGVGLTLAAPVATAFFIGLTAGRLGGAQALRLGWLTEKRLLYLTLCGGTLCGIAVALFPGQLLVVYPASVLIGWFYGPLFPSMMAIASRHFAQLVGLVSSAMMIGTGASMMLLPVLMGALIPTLGISRVIALPTLCCVIILPLVALTGRTQPGLFATQTAVPLQGEPDLLQHD